MSNKISNNENLTECFCYLLVFVFLFIPYKFNVYHFTIRPFDGVLVIVLFIWMVVGLKNNRLFIPNASVFYLYFVFILYIITSIIWAKNKSLALVEVVQWIEMFLLTLLISGTFLSRKKMERLVEFFFILIAIYSIYATFYSLFVLLTNEFNFQTFHKLTRINRRPGWFAALGAMYIFSKNISTLSYFKYNLYIFLLFIFGLVSILSMSRLSWISFLLMFITSLIIKKKSFSELRSIFICFIGVITICSIPLLSSNKLRKHFLKETSSLFKKNKILQQGRVAQWAIMINLYKHHPVLGVGINNLNEHISRDLYPDFIPYRPNWKRGGHNGVLRSLAELGPAGFLIFLSILLYPSVLIRKIPWIDMKLSYVTFIYGVWLFTFTQYFVRGAGLDRRFLLSCVLGLSAVLYNVLNKKKNKS